MAILYDTHTTGNTGSTFAHTCTGPNLILWVTIAMAQGAHTSAVTYDGVAMTNATRDDMGSWTVWYDVYYLLGAHQGTHNVVITGGSGYSSCSISYTGINQGGGIQTFGTAGGTGDYNHNYSNIALTTIPNDVCIDFGILAETGSLAFNYTTRAYGNYKCLGDTTATNPTCSWTWYTNGQAYFYAVPMHMALGGGSNVAVTPFMNF